MTDMFSEEARLLPDPRETDLQQQPIMHRYNLLWHSTSTRTFFHHELTIYSDILSTKISSNIQRDDRYDPEEDDGPDSCNASGEKLPLLICGSYPAVKTSKDYVYSNSEDASINNNLILEIADSTIAYRVAIVRSCYYYTEIAWTLFEISNWATLGTSSFPIISRYCLWKRMSSTLSCLQK